MYIYFFKKKLSSTCKFAQASPHFFFFFFAPFKLLAWVPSWGLTLAIRPVESRDSPHLKVWTSLTLPGYFYRITPSRICLGNKWRRGFFVFLFFWKIFRRFFVRKAIRVRKEPSFSKKHGHRCLCERARTIRQAAAGSFGCLWAGRGRSPESPLTGAAKRAFSRGRKWEAWVGRAFDRILRSGFRMRQEGLQICSMDYRAKDRRLCRFVYFSHKWCCGLWDTL